MVVVVDDERAFAEILVGMLREEGYLVERAHDGRQALAAIAASADPRLREPNVVFLRKPLDFPELQRLVQSLLDRITTSVA